MLPFDCGGVAAPSGLLPLVLAWRHAASTQQRQCHLALNR
jgi:hypothetical protein